VGLSNVMKKLAILLVSFLAIFSVVGKVFGDDCAAKNSLTERIACYESELSKVTSQAKTLSSQIAQFDAQIKLTTLKISQTQDKILLLGGRIDQLEISLDSLTKAFSGRAVETYKLSRFENNIFFVFSAVDITDAAARFHYLQKIQEEDRSLLLKLEEAQTLYKGEKASQEDLQKELENQKKNLAKQKQEKANLLAITRNDEKRYQSLLATARAEFAVLRGLGKETFLRDVSEGEKIGTIITGSSGCSSGTHLHFEVHNGSSVVDPSNFLKSISFTYDYAADQYGYYGTINPHGSWNWPLNEPIQINQGYGSHGYAQAFYAGGVHTGIDMDSNDNSVKTVKAGKLYGGSYQCGGTHKGTLLYAKVDQGDGITAWYLHMVPQ